MNEDYTILLDQAQEIMKTLNEVIAALEAIGLVARIERTDADGCGHRLRFFSYGVASAVGDAQDGTWGGAVD